MVSPNISELRALERREFQLRLADRLEQMLEAVLSGSLAEPRIFDHELESLSIRKLSPLDIDEDQPLDLEPVFFRPYPLPPDNDVRTLVENSQAEDTRPKWRHCQKFDRKRWCGDTSCAQFQMNWFHAAVGRDWRGLMLETPWAPGQRCMDSECTYHHRALENGKFVTWNSHHVKDNLKPHVMMAVKYPYPIPGGLGSVLRAEVASAIYCIIRQLRHGEFIDHRTLPVLVRTYYHDRGARITQAHWDDDHLVIRQSRVLDFHAPEPTDDAYLLVRWIANTPMGETRYPDFVCEDEDDASGYSQIEPHAMALTVEA